MNKGEAMLPVPFLITKVKKETKDTFTLELKPENDYFSFKAGQFNMLYQFGVGEVPISISGSPEKPEVLIHTIRKVGTVTDSIAKLKKGEVIGVSGPYGSDWPVEKAKGKDVVIVAGGLGLAPLRPAIYHIIANRKDYNKVFLLYGARDAKNIIFAKELNKWKKHFYKVEVTVDVPSSEWTGNVGVITTLIKKVNIPSENLLAMVCGPEIMMRFSVIELENKGVKAENIYLSMERNMKCAIGFCGHCQYGPKFICKDGPVFCYPEIEYLINKREV